MGDFPKSKPHHILSLVIRKQDDIAGVRAKIKLLAGAMGCRRLQVVQFAVSCSETARLLLTQYGGGRMRVSVFPLDGTVSLQDCGLEFLFQGFSYCRDENGLECSLHHKEILATAPFPGLQKIFPEVEVQGGTRGVIIAIRYQTGALGVSWKKLQRSLRRIRNELFKDTEESYLENLRAKHDEVLRLLKEKDEQVRLLDMSNQEILHMSNDLEELARERTIIEMSLKIADRILNPATIIGALARQLIRKGDLSGKRLEKLQQITLQTERMENIVRQFKKMADERRNLFSRIDLGQLVEESLQFCQTITERGLQPQVTKGKQPVYIHANRQILKIAVTHILRHVAGKILTGGSLHITINQRKDCFMRINGTTAENLKADSDQKAETAPEKSDKISGERLELVRQILTEHQATLDVETIQQPKPQIRITVRFPLIFSELST